MIAFCIPLKKFSMADQGWPVMRLTIEILRKKTGGK